MAGAVVRISEHGRKELRRLAKKAKRSMQFILDDAIEVYRRKCLLEEANHAYDALRRNPKEWRAELKERKL